MSETCDVAIVGAGSAGLSALREVRKSTDRFLIINDGPWGTTCARVGCMPSKALIEAAHAWHRRESFESFGIEGAEDLHVDIPRVLERVRRLRDYFVAETLKSTHDLGDRAISGRARLTGPDTLEVNGRRIEATKIILATGSSPIVPEAWAALGERILTSDTIFEQQTLPGRMAVIGLGPGGVELAQSLARLGIEICGFSAGDNLAGLSDPEVARVARQLLEKDFAVQVCSRAEVEAHGVGLKVSSASHSIVVDKALVALGRQPNLNGLGLERMGILLDERGLPPIDRRTLQIADLPLYLAGDANDQKPLLHEAVDDGFIAGYNAIHTLDGAQPECFERRVPLGIVFTDPNIATVGQAFESLDPNRIIIGSVDYSQQGRARTAEENRGLLRTYADKANGRLLGAELCAPRGEHMAHLLALALQQKLTVRELLRMPFYHPVIEEGLRTTLREIVKQIGDISGPDLTACGRAPAGA